MTATAKQMMTAPALTVSPQASLAEVATLLSLRRISAVPVCEADGTLAGIVSEADVLRPFRATLQARRDWWLALLADGESLSQDFLDYLRQDTRTAKDVMTRHVHTADETATLPELAELMVTHGKRSLPILHNGRVIGIVTRADLVTALARAPGMLV